MNWNQQWIEKVLTEIPAGSYRRRMEAELRDHMETQCRALMEAGRAESEARAETLRMMGEPGRLQAEYQAAWRRTLPGRLAELRHQVISWAVGFAVMLGVQTLASYMQVSLRRIASSFPRNSQGLWVSLIRNISECLDYSWHWFLFPLTFALIAGAYYLSRRFRASRHPAWQISAGLSFYWAAFVWLDLLFEAADDHMTVWEELKHLLIYGIRYTKFYFLTLILCVLLGTVFGHLFVEKRKSPAA